MSVTPSSQEHRAGPSRPAIVDLTERLENTAALDRLAAVYQPIADALLSDRRRAEALQGMWLSHAVHPLLTMVPIGCWTSASLLDLVGGRAARPGARRLVGIGILAAVPTAVTGLAEFGPLGTRDKRTASVHALSNVTGLTFYLSSYRARRQGQHLKGALLALGGMSAASLGGYLGGHLTEARKVSSRHPAYDADDAVGGDDTAVLV